MPPIQKGSTVLVTGANGFIGSHIVDQLLQLDYKVRGTVRTEAKGKWVQDFFDNKYGQGKLELVVVPAMGVKGAFDDAVKGQLLLKSLCSTSTNNLQVARESSTSRPTFPSPRTLMRSSQMSSTVSPTPSMPPTRNPRSNDSSLHRPLLLQPTRSLTRSSTLTSHHGTNTPSIRPGLTHPTLRRTEPGTYMALARLRESRLYGNMSRRTTLTLSATPFCLTRTLALFSTRARMLALPGGFEKSSPKASMRYSSKSHPVRYISRLQILED